MNESKPAQRGRPRDTNIDAALLGAFEALLHESGFTAVTVQALVTRAGTNRDTFYNRYKSLGHFLIHVAACRYPVTSTDGAASLYADLMAIQRDQIAMYTDGVADALLPLMLDACARDAVVAAAFEEQFLRPRRDATVRVLERAVGRGDIPPVEDVPYILDLISGALLLRAALPHMAPIDEALAHQTVMTVLTELGADTTAFQSSRPGDHASDDTE